MSHDRPDNDHAASSTNVDTLSHSHHEAPKSRVRRPLNRRVVLQAAAGVSAIAVAGGIGGSSVLRSATTRAAESGGTRAGTYTSADTSNQIAAASVGDFQTFVADYPFFALGANWPGSVGQWPVIEIQVSTDGENWGETFRVAASTEDGGRPTREDRLFTPLIFTSGETDVRFRTVDQDGVPGVVEGLSFTYIDSTDGPWEADIDSEQTVVAALTDDRVPPTIVTRQAWNADESRRYDTYGEIWPSEYETVRHAIVHHTDTSTAQDSLMAIRAIYYYHAVDQGWGDIGYNYLVDKSGRIYEGRYGGQNVIGGHSYQYAFGSSGICIIGDYQDAPPTNQALAGLVAILSWVVRDLDPLGTETFHEIVNLPVICAHRDVNSTTCPGNQLYYDIPEVRSLVAATLDSGNLDTDNPGGIAVRDRVIVQTDDEQPLNIRSSATSSASVVGQIPNGTIALVVDGPVVQPDENWYRIQWTGQAGWVSARYLIVSPPEPPPVEDGDYAFGVNIRFTTTTNIRTQPTTSASIIAEVPRNAWAFVMAGPIVANTYEWYKVRAENIGDGWAIKSNFAAAPVNLSPVAKFVVGDTVEATGTVNIRPRPGVAQTITAKAYAGSQFKISQPALEVTEYIWYGAYGSFGGGWVVENSLKKVTTPDPGAAKFAIGDTIRVTSAVNFRSSPGTSAPVISLLAAGTTGTVVGGPGIANGYTWYQFKTSGVTTGWAIQDSLEKTTVTPTTTTTKPPVGAKFVVGDTLRVTEAINFRSAPGTSASIISQLPSGTIGTVLGGPTTANGYIWYQFRTSGGTTGWGVQDWLEKTTTPGTTTTTTGTPGTTTTTTTLPPVGGKFVVGDSIRVTEAINFRSSAGTSASIISQLPAGTTGTVVGGPTSANGYMWYQFRTSGGTTGWGVQDWLEKVTTPTTTTGAPGTTTTTTAPPSGGKFVVGDSLVVTEAVNVRSAAGTSNGIVTFLSIGATATVLGGPMTANSLIWWNIRTADGKVGWSIEDAFEKAGTTTTKPPVTNKFIAGDAIRVSETVNLRASASTSAAIVTVLEANVQATVLSGPQSGSGYIWYRIQTTGGSTGWAVQDWLVKR